MAPRNVVLVGASDRNWSDRVHQNLVRFGYPGRIFPVNPNRKELWGLPCFASISDLPEAPDHLAIFLPNEQMIRALEEGGALGARSASLFAAGFGEGGDDEGRVRATRLKSVLEQYGIAAAGPNCMGLAVGAARFTTIPDEHLEPLTEGPVAVLCQSGALAQTFSRGLLDAGLGIGYIVSCGNQTGLTFADYIDHLAGDPKIRVICCYIESVVDAGAFLAAARHATASGKHVVVLKAGGNEAAREAALAHTGALTGSLEAFDALAGDAGVIRVDNLEDAVEAASMLSVVGRPAGRRLAVMTNSGAFKSIVTARAEHYGLSLPDLQDLSRASILQAIADADVSNPFDTKRTLPTDAYIASIRALHDDPGVDAVLIAEELPRDAGIERKVQNFLALDAFVAEEATKPVVVFSPLTFRETPYMRELRSRLSHLPWLRDVSKTLRTLAKVALDAHQRGVAEPPSGVREDLRKKWLAYARDLAGPVALSEVDSKALLADYGIPLLAEVVTSSPEQAAQAAEHMGYPVVLKAVSAAVPHKSDAGLVALDLRDAASVLAAGRKFQEICAKLPAALEGYLVAPQVKDGVEMLVGIQRDPEMGCVVIVGLGGVWLELFKDVALAPPYLERERALATIARTRASALLAGYRGAPARDVSALADSLVALGRMALELGDIFES
ncbi:MAG: acetyl-CoA synthetase, partial [Hyphomicrobiales bacterium]|nr:acetyl-CoA synthetase [Hyphomicrobiales bacterium]